VVPSRAPAGDRGNGGRRQALRVLAVPAVSVIVYFAVRPAIGSDTAALAIAGAVPAADTALSVMTGGFLVLHALLNLALALTLSTTAYLTAGRAVSWATLAVGALCLHGYLRRLRRDKAGP
jgi:hypothetical protein